MTALKEQLESLSSQHVEGIVLSHPGEPHVSIPDGPAASIIDLSEERQRRRGRYILTAVAAAVVLVGFLIFTNSGDDNSAPSPVATEGGLDGPIAGPNGEDLGIWSDAILALGPQGDADRSLERERSIVRSLPEINKCVVETMGSEPFEIEWLFADGDGTGIVPAPIAGEPAFAASEGFGIAAGFESSSAYPTDVDTCYYASTVEGLNGPDAWASREFVAATSLGQLVSLGVPFDPEVSPAGPIEALISEDPAIVENENSWSACMDARGFQYDSDVQARADVFRRYGELDEANRSVFNGPSFLDTPEFAAMKAEEIEIATASWDCSGGEAGAILRENARQRALADFVVTYREDLEVQYGNDLFTACQSAKTMASDEAADIQERGEARLQNLGCE
ncbi:MAG: hypothetical protein R8J94_20860 [Acidimicrobiia bacterium]|nr:hypothetical protein [Acidimicrobiia bacterium]